MALDAELSRIHGLHPAFAETCLGQHIADLRKCTLGPVPVDMFLKELLPLSSSTDIRGRLSSRSAFSGVPQRADSPARIYVPLLHALNKRTKTKSRCPGFEFVDTYERSRKPTHPGYAKPHICCFSPDNARIVRDASPRSRLEFAYAELFIQVASDPATDFFVDPPAATTEDASEATDHTLRATNAHEFLREFDDEYIFEEAERMYGLHIAYATEIFARQHRLFLFSISLHGSNARFFRRDRAGCLVSKAFDIRRQPQLLTDFLWRFSQLSDAKRGLDTTVRLASPHEEAMFRDAIRDEVRLQLEIEGDELEKAVSAHYLRGHVAVIPVTSRRPLTSEEREHRFIVSRPIVSPLTLPGRGTRGFWAVDAKTGRVVFLKDCWRFYWAEQIEGDILQGLNELGVRNVPLLAVHGYVPVVPSDGERASEAYLGDPWVCKVGGQRVRINELWHYRFVTSTVGYSLESLQGTEELFTLIANECDVQAMRDALEKDSRIHRDLSVGNIILVKEPDRAVRKGYLIDWEVSDRIDDSGESLHCGRVGTFKFMSIRMLDSDQANGKHTFADDMEALLYVVFHCALYYLPHDLSPWDLTSFTEGFFDSYMRYPGGVLHGGSGKFANAHDRLFTKNVHFQDTAFDEWLQAVMDLHCQPIDRPKREENLWTLENLDAYWTKFLEAHNLERGNRQVHKPLEDETDDSCSPSSSPSPTNNATTAKRRIDELDLDQDRAPKAACRRVDSSTQYPPNSQIVHASPSPRTVLRRSERIRAQAATVQAQGARYPARIN
ncbi:hypothetical protein PYCCODRAFT_1367390 [Trametes coccinea BRFM310]|uniref:Fungal-type protein kinase domain-containing protein n=1 Tax=Trametes coccinea (strain BRFM310) TaxID=1353009 RepID=A0A1Y2IMR7_TRAC3|nr:hypothetical protein PYCCODRAFT_1367390 [Trametes coccinea BRFM310]